jgi:hypothetical protein
MFMFKFMIIIIIQTDLKVRDGICAHRDIYKYLLKLGPSQSLRSWASSATNQAKISAIVLQDYAKKVPDTLFTCGLVASPLCHHIGTLYSWVEFNAGSILEHSPAWSHRNPADGSVPELTALPQ